MPVRPLYRDAFSPVLLSSEVLDVSLEQKDAIRAVLDVACSDSRFAEKAYVAIARILTGGSVKVPTIASLTPGSATIGDPSFVLHVHGTNFTPGSIIVFAGQEEPTTYVSPTEVTTGVDMSVWLGPDTLPVGVLSEDGVFSNAVSFVFQAPAALLASSPAMATKVAPATPTPAVKK